MDPQPTTGAPPWQPPPVPVPVTGRGLGSRIKETYNAAQQRAGRFLSWDDPMVVLIWQVLGGLSPEQAREASMRGARYAQQNGRLLSDAEVDQLVSDVKTRLPAQWDPAYGAGKSFQEAFQNVQAEFPAETIAGNDPRLLAAVRRDPQLQGLTDAQIAQIVQTGRQFTHGTGLAAGAGLDPLIGTMVQRNVPLPHQMSPSAYDAIQRDPVSKGLFEGALGARGWDVGSYTAAHAAARPRGTAPRTTVSRWANPQGVWG